MWKQQPVGPGASLTTEGNANLHFFVYKASLPQDIEHLTYFIEVLLVL